jgi:hypothetical protein
MPYDPQRSHRRPRLADDAPAPIDSLLGNGSEPEAAEEAAAGDADRPAVESTDVVELLPEPPESHGLDTEPRSAPDVEAPAADGRGARVVAVVASLLVVVLALVWFRRHRRRR